MGVHGPLHGHGVLSSLDQPACHRRVCPRKSGRDSQTILLKLILDGLTVASHHCGCSLSSPRPPSSQHDFWREWWIHRIWSSRAKLWSTRAKLRSTLIFLWLQRIGSSQYEVDRRLQDLAAPAIGGVVRAAHQLLG